MANKIHTIPQARSKKGLNEAGKKRTKKQKENRGVDASFLILEQVQLLKNPAELLSMIDNLIKKYSNKDEDMARFVDEKDGVITYEFMEKNLCLSVGRHVESAFKNHKPELKIQNPHDNEFYRIVVKFK